MNRLKKSIIVRYLLIKSSDNFISNLALSFKTNIVNGQNVRIISVRNKRYLIKVHNEDKYQGCSAFFITVVRERNTWQTRALSNGTISGIPLNQGIIGDPYYFLIIPDKRILLGFTTGPSGSLKTVANTILQQFKRDRNDEIQLEHYSKGKEISKLNKLKGFSKLFFRINATSLGEPTEDTPDFLRNLFSIPFMFNNSELALTISDFGEDGFSEKELIDVVDYLSENNGCTALIVHGVDAEGEKVFLDFNKAYFIYRTQVELRTKYISEEKANDLLREAIKKINLSELN